MIHFTPPTIAMKGKAYQSKFFPLDAPPVISPMYEACPGIFVFWLLAE